MQPSWTIRVVRALFLTVCVLVAIAVGEGSSMRWFIRACIGAAAGALLVLLEASLGRFSFRRLTHAVVGLLVGMAGATILVRFVVVALFRSPWFIDMLEADKAQTQSNVELVIYAILAFFGVALALRSDREEFALLIPYLRFKRDASEGEPILLDTNIIIDGRITKLAATGFLSGSLVVPRLVLDELQKLSDSRDTLKSERGKRGLDLLQQLRSQREIDLTIHEDGATEDLPVDTRLVSVAKALNARLLTNDENLANVARLRGINVLSLSHLVKALQQELLVGEQLDVTLSKPGKDKGQAIAYLPDGAMVVVNQAANLLGQRVLVGIVGTTQTAAGKLIFAEIMDHQASQTATKALQQA